MWLALVAALSMQDPEPGISHDLARARAEIVAAVHYRLHFDLFAGADRLQGSADIQFDLTKPPAALAIDFGGLSRGEVRINDVPLDTAASVHNHWVLPGKVLRSGSNRLRAEFTAAIAATGAPVTSYRDPKVNEEYQYTLLVPADAHRLFPCFDQPDLKAVFELSLSTPADWLAVANGTEIERRREGQRVVWKFAATRPISTYLFAFAAGPFALITGQAAKGSQRMFVRRSRLRELEAERIEEMHVNAVDRLSQYFGHPYPFGKLDYVLLPGFPFGGMEHAGAIFYAENQLVFDHAPTDGELVRRSTLIYHEVAHQWFGNLVTMKWFDDLWLKEGFATFVGYKLLDQLEPERKAWLRFHQRVKPAAYQVDATAGTTPIWQELSNLAEAKSTYGAIVYNKAPAVLRELEVRMSPDRFQSGVQNFVRSHAFANATWSDLVEALRSTDSADLPHWSKRWILAPGMPRLRTEWTARDGKIDRITIHQRSSQGDQGTWPIRVVVALFDADGGVRRETVQLQGASTELTTLIGQPTPVAVLLNPGDEAYGQFLLDPQSLEYFLGAVSGMTDSLTKAIVLSAVYECVREAELAPRRYVEMALDLATRETDPETHSWLLSTLGTCLTRYLPVEDAAKLRVLATDRLLAALLQGMPGRELDTFRFLVRYGRTATDSTWTKVLEGRRKVPGLVLGSRDRSLAAAGLLAAGQPEAFQRLKDDVSADAARNAYVAGAADPDPASKAQYFTSYANPTEPPEQWMQDSLAFFHWPGQESVTLPYLQRALDQVEWVAKNRKIFFMPAWIDGFVNGHSSPAALAVLREFLTREDLPTHIRRKLIQSTDGLERAVRIKARWQ